MEPFEHKDGGECEGYDTFHKAIAKLMRPMYPKALFHVDAGASEVTIILPQRQVVVLVGVSDAFKDIDRHDNTYLMYPSVRQCYLLTLVVPPIGKNPERTFNLFQIGYATDEVQWSDPTQPLPPVVSIRYINPDSAPNC